MKNTKNNFNVKVLCSKLVSILLICSFITAFSCSSVQYGFDAREHSIFSKFNNLGIAKEDFIKQYGLPTNKAMSEEKSGIVERLYYTERIKDFLVTTEFIFLNNSLKKMERDDSLQFSRSVEVLKTE